MSSAEARTQARACVLPPQIANFMSDLSSKKNSDREATLYQMQTHLIKAVKEKKDCGLLWFNLGHTFYLRSDFRRASIAYEKVIALKSTLAPAAKFYLSKAKRRSGKTVAAVLALSEVDKLSLPFELQPELEEEKKTAYAETIDEALIDLKKGQNDEAEKKLIAALHLRSDFYSYAALAVALHKQGRWEREQTTLDYARELHLSSTQARIAHLLRRRLDGVDRFAEDRIWHLRTDLAFGYDDNVTRVSNDREKTRSQVLRFLLEGENVYHVSSSLRSSVKFGLTADNYERLPSEKYTTFYLVAKNVLTLDGFRFQFSPQLSYELYSDRPYWLRTGAYTEASYTSQAMNFSLSGEFWRNKKVSDTYSQIDGSSKNITATVGRRLGESVVLVAGYSYNDFSIGDDERAGVDRVPQAYSGSGPFLRTSWAFSNDWLWDATIDHQHRDFKSSYLPQDKKRIDQITSASLRIRRQLSERFGIYAQATRSIRTSTMDATSPLNENVESLTAYIGLSWEAF